MKVIFSGGTKLQIGIRRDPGPHAAILIEQFDPGRRNDGLRTRTEKLRLGEGRKIEVLK